MQRPRRIREESESVFSKTRPYPGIIANPITGEFGTGIPYPPKTDAWMIGKLEKKLIERQPLTRIREMVTAAKSGGRTYSHLAQRLRTKMLQYESNTPSLSTNQPQALIRGHMASASVFTQILHCRSPERTS